MKKKLVHKIGLKHGLPDEVIQEVIESPFKLMRQEIPLMEDEEEFKNFRVINLGIFYFLERKLKRLKENESKK